MKILMLTQEFPPTVGGIGVHVFELSKALVKQGNDVYVLTPKNVFHEKNYEQVEGIRVYRTQRLNIKFLATISYLPFAKWKIGSIMANECVDVIHCHSLFLSILTKIIKSNKPKVLTEHESQFLTFSENERNRKLLAWLLNHYDWIIGPSKELVNTCIKFGVNLSRISFIPNGVDLGRFNPKISGKKIREKHRIPAHTKVILCPRRLEPKNGVWYLIKAIPGILEYDTDVKCLIVGNGSEMDKLRKEVLKTKITDHVMFAGSVAHSEIPNYYAASDIVVLPSLKEATSIAGLEAMASGKPLVGTNVGGIPEIIDNNKTGILVPSKNSESLAVAISSLLLNDKKRGIMGLNARKKSETEFSWEAIAKKTLDIYRKTSSKGA